MVLTDDLLCSFQESHPGLGRRNRSAIDSKPESGLLDSHPVHFYGPRFFDKFENPVPIPVATISTSWAPLTAYTATLQIDTHATEAHSSSRTPKTYVLPPPSTRKRKRRKDVNNPPHGSLSSEMPAAIIAAPLPPSRSSSSSSSSSFCTCGRRIWG